MNPRHMNRSTSRVILSGFALVGVLLATVSVLGQVNAFSAITDAIGVTSPPGTSQSSSGSSTSSPSADETSNEETSDSVVDAPATGDTPDGEVAPIDPEIDARISALEDLVVTLAENDDATAATLSEVTGLVKTLDADLATAKTSLGNLAERVGDVGDETYRDTAPLHISTQNVVDQGGPAVAEVRGAVHGWAA